MKILIIHGYSDSNKGDLAIVVGMLHGIRCVYPNAELVLQSVFSESDPDFDYHHRFIRRLGVNVEQMSIPSPYRSGDGGGRGRHVTAMFNLLKDTLAERLLLAMPILSGLFPLQAKALNSMASSNFILLKGGQYIYNDQGGLRGWLYLWRILRPIYVARRFRRKAVVMGQSIGPLVNVRGRQNVSRALGLCSQIIVRERKSLA